MNIKKEVKLVQKGDKEAFTRLVKQVEVNLYRIAKAFLKQDEDSANAIRETILLIYKQIMNNSRLEEIRALM